MRELTELKDGVATKVTILNKGQEITFRLGVFTERKEYDPSKVEIGFGFISPEEFYIDGFYSGGITGTGVAGWDWENKLAKLPPNMNLVTTNLNDILEMGKKADQDRKEAWEKRIKEQYEKTDRINKAKAHQLIGQIEDLRFYAIRTKAHFDPKYSAQIQFAIMVKCIKGGTNPGEKSHRYFEWGEHRIKDEYITSSGGVQVSKFRKNMKEWGVHLGEITNEELKSLIIRMHNGIRELRTKFHNM